MANEIITDFLQAVESVLLPLIRLPQQSITPAAVQPNMVQNEWTDYEAKLSTKWLTNNASGVVTTQSGLNPLPGFTLGNGTLSARYYRDGRVVRVRVQIVLGTTTQWNDQIWRATPNDFDFDGNAGSYFISLPFPAPTTDFLYCAGSGFTTCTQVTPGGVVFHQPSANNFLYDNNVSFVPVLSPGATKLELHNPFFSGCKGPLTYNPNYAGRNTWSVGDVYDLNFRYEVDVDA